MPEQPVLHVYILWSGTVEMGCLSYTALICLQPALIRPIIDPRVMLETRFAGALQTLPPRFGLKKWGAGYMRVQVMCM